MTVDLRRLPEALRDHGLRVVETDGWLSRGYDTVDFLGQLNHHTAIRGPCTPSTAQAMIRGRSDLEGPLCNGHGGLDDRGGFVVYLIAARRARHAGPGSGVVLGEFRRDVHVERTAAQRGLADDAAAHGNRHLFGWEWQHPGDGSPWPAALLEGMGRCNAALADLAGWHPNRSKGHKHWTRRKIDPSWTGSLPALTARYLEDQMTPEQESRITNAIAAVRADLNTVKATVSEIREGQTAFASLVIKGHPAGKPGEDPGHTGLNEIGVTLSEIKAAITTASPGCAWAGPTNVTVRPA